METKINMQPPLDIWPKIHYLVLLVDEIAEADLKVIGSKEVQTKLQIAHSMLDDPSLKEWLNVVRKLKEQKVLKVTL